MAKILLAEDDNNLREIYEARLQAEGYTVISSGDGEEALVLAKDQLPDLIISDVMMPKISGFEMLDIVRNTDGLKNTKVIMLTALGQSEDQDRADKLGADRYLVKSQVTLEDIVKVAKELLGSDDVSTATNDATQSTNTQTNNQETQNVQVQDTDMPLASEPPQQEPTTIPVQDSNPTTQDVSDSTKSDDNSTTQDLSDNTTNSDNSTNSPNDQLIDNALGNLSVDSASEQAQNTDMPLASEPPQQEPTSDALDSTQASNMVSEALSEESEKNSVDDEIQKFSNELGSNDSNNQSEASDLAQTKNMEQTQPDTSLSSNVQPVQNNPIQIPVQNSDSESDSSVPVSPPENVIPYSTNSYKPKVVNPDTLAETDANNNSNNIDPTNITL